MRQTPRSCRGRRIVAVAALTLLVLGGESRHRASEPDPATDDAICQTTPDIGRRFVDIHAARAASLTSPSLMPPAAALTGTVPAVAFDPDRIEQGSVIDMGGVIVMVDDGSGIFGTPLNSSGLRLDIVQLAKTYYAARADDVDTLVFFANFDHSDGTFHALVQNRVAGINRAQINDALVYGSSGRLEGVIVFANLRQKPLDPAARFPADHNTHLSLLAHEWGHKFGAYVHGPDPDNLLALLGRGQAHWCFFHDTRSAFFPVAMSALEGNRWGQGFEGNWLTQGATDGYSPLDLYLMGFFAPEEVPPFFYIDAAPQGAGCDRSPVSSPPSPSATAAGPQQIVTIDEVIAANGTRLPDHTQSPRDFRMGMVLLARQGRFPSTADVARLERLRQEWEPYFSVATGGRATMDTSSGPPPDPATTFAIVRIPQDVQAGHPFGFAVLALDASGRVATGYDGTVRFSSATDPGAVLPTDVTFTPLDRGYVALLEPAMFSVGGSLSITVTDTVAAQITGTRARIAVESSEVTICVPDGIVPTSASTRPWGIGVAFAGSRGVRFQYLIHRNQLGRPGMITSLNWKVLGGPDRVDWDGVVMSLAHKREFDLFSSLSIPFPMDENIADSEDVTTVLAGRLHRTGMTESGRLHFRLFSPFPYNGIDHLLVEVRYSGGVPPQLNTGQLLGGPEMLTVERIGTNTAVPRTETGPICVGLRITGNGPPTVIGLEMEEIANSSARVGWRTSPSTIGRVLYGEAGAPLDRSTEFQRFDIAHSILISGLLPGTSYEAITESIDLDNQLVTDGPIAFTTTEKRPSIGGLTPDTLPQGTLNTLVRVRGENFFPGLAVEIVLADTSPGVAPVPDPTARIVAFNRLSDVALDLGVIVDADAVPGPRRLHLVNDDGFETISDLFFGVQPPPGAVDIDTSGRVDGFDLAQLARAFGARFGEARYDPAADLDGDGDIDGIDLTLLADRFGS